MAGSRFRCCCRSQRFELHCLSWPRIANTDPALTAAGRAWTLTLSGETGQKYQLQYNAGLCPTGWTNLGDPVTATGPVVNALDPSPAGAQRFYRAVALPQRGSVCEKVSMIVHTAPG